MFKRLCLSALLTTAVACGSSSPTAPSSSNPTPTPTPTPAPVTVAKLTVDGNGCGGGVCVSPGPLQLTAIAHMSNGATQNVTSQAQWTSSNPGVASVTGSGAVTPINAGDTDVLATYQGQSDGQTIRVPAPWAQSGRSDTVFDMPSYVRRVRITGDYTGYSSNFIVRIAGRVVVNELVGTGWKQTSFVGTYVTTGGVVEITDSSGVAWSFTQVR